MSITPMRIVLASMGPAQFRVLHSACEAAGHVPVAYMHSRSMTPRGEVPSYARERIAGTLAEIPSTVDLLLPADCAGVRRALTGYRPDLVVVYGWNWIMPPEVLALPTHGVVNIHPSLLPRYRGPNPVGAAIRNGESHIGVTVHRMDEGVDTGNILVQRDGIALPEDVSLDVLSREQVLPVIAELLPEALAMVSAGDPGTPQPDGDLPRADRFGPGFFVVDWSQPAATIHNQVRTFRAIGSTEAPKARMDGEWVRLVRTSLVPTEGTRMRCGDGDLWVTQSQPTTPPQVEG